MAGISKTAKLAQTSPRVASLAAVRLDDPASSPTEKSLAGTALRQYEPTLASVLQRNALWGPDVNYLPQYSSDELKRAQLLELLNRHTLPSREAVMAIYDQ